MTYVLVTPCRSGRVPAPLCSSTAFSSLMKPRTWPIFPGLPFFALLAQPAFGHCLWPVRGCRRLRGSGDFFVRPGRLAADLEPCYLPYLGGASRDHRDGLKPLRVRLERCRLSQTLEIARCQPMDSVSIHRDANSLREYIERRPSSLYFSPLA